MTNSRYSFPIPDGYRIRRAIYTDICQLIIQLLQFSNNSNNLISEIKYLSLTLYFALVIISFLLLITIFSYFVGEIVISDLLFNNLLRQLNLPDYLWFPLRMLLYGTSSGYSERLNLFGNLIAFIITFIIFLPLIIIYLRQFYANTWVVEYNQKIVALARMSHHYRRITLDRLYVAPTYRHQGIGSALVSYIINHFQEPIHLICETDLVPFYSRLGFILVTQSSWLNLGLPPSLKRMVRDNSLATLNQNVSNASANVIASDFLIRRAQNSDAYKICWFLLSSPTMDIFLPFGITIYLVILIITFVFALIALSNIFLLLITVYVGQILGIYYFASLSLLAFVFIVVLLILSAIVSVIFQSRQVQNFWLLERDRKLIGYVRFSDRGRYSILRYLYLGAEKNLKLSLIERVIPQIIKPIYIACDRNQVSLYTTAGFTSINIENLPPKLRFGARINHYCGGSNLIYLGNQVSDC